MLDRLGAVRARIISRKADAALVSALPDIRWACGFSGSNGLLIVTAADAHLITDGRYTAQADREVQGAHIHIAPKGLIAHIADQRLAVGLQRVVVQADHLTLDLFHQIQEQLPGPTWLPVAGLLQQDVAVKSAEEVACIRRAQHITDDVFAHLVGFLRAGLTEREVAAEIVYQHLRRGASSMSFDPIVASGPNGALPHARPTDRPLQAGDLVVLDFGGFVDGYASDMTRTVAIGEPEPAAVEVYHIVLEAQRRALEAARAGLTTRALDAVARTYIGEQGYGAQFSHGLGHGVGLQIHEWPSVSFRTEDVLPAGAVVTIEPGIYLPGRFGVRIEDMVLLQPDGALSLAASSKALIRVAAA
jgi:Xaa-Pro aminopeptidase